MTNNITDCLDPLTVTVNDACRLLGFKDRKSVYNLVRSGKIRARKAGRLVLINYKSLKAYAEGED